MKILAQFGIFIRIRILNIGGKNAHTHFYIFNSKFSVTFTIFEKKKQDENLI